METSQISLGKLHDAELLISTKNLAQRERELTTEIIRHLAEISKRKLYADLKYPSLFEYAVRELGYSEAAASRRIAAMHMVREMPELEQKIESGALNLSNIARAQTFFREIARVEPGRVVSRAEKTALLEKLEQKSTREGERILFAMNGPAAQSRERVRQIDLDYTEFSFTGDAALKAKLQRVRSLLGPRGGLLSLAELVSHMADLATEQLEERKFGKRRVQAERARVGDIRADALKKAPPLGAASSGAGTGKAYTRYIPQSVKHAVWRAAGGKCSCCGSQNNLQFDHVHPVALGGSSTPANLQLLCGSCNLRRGIKTFGTGATKRR